MKQRWLAVMALFFVLGFTPSLMADNGKHQGKGNKHDNQVWRGDRDDDDRWERRNGYEYRVYGDRDGRPPGWSRGRKTGWGNCGLPPGQAKKYGCRSYVYRGRQHYWYRDDAGRIFIRRPSIHVE